MNISYMDADPVLLIQLSHRDQYLPVFSYDYSILKSGHKFSISVLIIIFYDCLLKLQWKFSLILITNKQQIV